MTSIRSPSRGRKQGRDFITAYRTWDRDNKGVSPEVFWNIAKHNGIKVPKQIPVTV